MKIYLKSITLCCALLAIVSCTSTKIFVANSLAPTKNYIVTKDVIYEKHSSLETLNVYQPSYLEAYSDVSLAAKPVIIFIQGGCWGACNLRDKGDYLFVGEALASNNYIVVIANFRSYPNFVFSEMMDDVNSLVKWTREGIDVFGGDPENVFIMGHSSGAHMAAMISLDERYSEQSSLRGFIGLAGPYDFLPFTESYQEDLFGPSARFHESQPIHFVDGGEPPMLLLHGGMDESVRVANSRSLSERSLNLGGDASLIIYDTLDHGELIGTMALPYRSENSVLADIAKFVGKYRKRKDYLQ